jgi:predicted metal-binding membrane protein
MLLTAMLKSANLLLSGIVLVVAGLYQWSPWKNSCLEHCRGPLLFIQRHGGFRPQAGASVLLGLRHGLYCIGCCWALMLLLFVGGVMNMAWIAGLAALVLVEKLWSQGLFLSRAVGLAAIAGGLLLAGRHFGIW